MKFKKADWTLSNVGGLLLAVLILLALGGGCSKMYNTTIANNEIETAIETIDSIEIQLNAIEDGGVIETQGKEFKNEWFISAWSKDDPNRPDDCFFQSCICICEESCEYQKTRFCRKLEIDKIEIYSPGITPAVGVEFNTEKIIVPPNMLRIEVKKSTNEQKETSAILTYLSQKYLDDKETYKNRLESGRDVNV